MNWTGTQRKPPKYNPLSFINAMAITTFNNLSQVEIEQLEPQEFSYYLAHGDLADFVESEYQRLLRHLLEYDL